MEKKMFAFTSLLAGFLGLVIFSSFNELSTDTLVTDEAAVPAPSRLQQHISAFDLDKTFSFAGEDVPASNFDAVERLDRELVINSYLHSATLLNIKMANRYFPVIETILTRYGVPDDFKYLCVAESNLRMATSPAGAKGLWQFMKPSGLAYGLEIQEEVDERYHVEKSTEAACKFILHLKKRFGSWTLAAAAYNTGETILSKRLEAQKATSYYDLNLTEETSRYVFRILAIKEILQDPGHFGFFVAPEHLYAPLDEVRTIEIDKPVPDLAQLALEHGTTYRMLKVLNPWLTGSALTNKSGKRYEILIPKT